MNRKRENYNPDAIEEEHDTGRPSPANQLEMLTLRLSDDQLYGIDVFKIIEILECPVTFNRVPHAHASVKGVITFRGQGITVVDLSQALGLMPVDYQNELCYLVVCEHCSQLNAFLVKQTETLLTRRRSQLKKQESFPVPCLIALTSADDDEMILILDVGNVLEDIVGLATVTDQKAGEPAKQSSAEKNEPETDEPEPPGSPLRQTAESLGLFHEDIVKILGRQ
jgi:two-component system chemotaxis response regulator CheV